MYCFLKLNSDVCPFFSVALLVNSFEVFALHFVTLPQHSFGKDPPFGAHLRSLSKAFLIKNSRVTFPLLKKKQIMVKIQCLIYWSKDIHFLNLVISVAFSLTIFPVDVTLNCTEKSHHFFI